MRMLSHSLNSPLAPTFPASHIPGTAKEGSGTQEHCPINRW